MRGQTIIFYILESILKIWDMLGRICWSSSSSSLSQDMIRIFLFMTRYNMWGLTWSWDDLQPVWTGLDDGMTEFQLIEWKLHPTTIEYSSSGKTVLNLLNIKVKLIFWRNMFDLTALCEEWWVSVLVRLFNVGTSMPLRKKHWEAS